MEFRKVLALRGPNVWARFPVLEAWVDLGSQSALSPTNAANFYQRLKGWLPSLGDRSSKLNGKDTSAARTETNLAHILENVALELQIYTAAPVEFACTAETADPRVYRVAVQYSEEGHGRACLALAHELCLAAFHDRPFNPALKIERLRWLYNEAAFGPSTKAIVQAARDRGIPIHRLCEESLTQLGDGVHQRRFRTAVTDQTGAIGHHIAQYKDLTKSFLRQVGVPVPEGRAVTSAEDAWEAAREVGLPVVVKPQDGNHGRGVSLNLKTREHVLEAYDCALSQAADGGVLVESYAPGTEHRLLVVGGKMVAALRGEPDQVFGDGVQTVEELVNQLNRDPRRGEFYRCLWKPVLLDESAVFTLEQQGLQLNSIPEADRKVIIHQNGEYTIDCTEQVHPEVAARAVLAAQTVGLDVAGMDMIATDISRPLEEQGGVIVEVNAGPGINMHLVPLSGKRREVGQFILETMFPSGATGRIPMVAVAGTRGRTIATQRIGHILRHADLQFGMTTVEGTFFNARRLSRRDGTTATSVRNVRMNPWVQAGVFETSAEGIFHEGLGFDRCDVAVITHLGEEAERNAEIDTSEQPILQHTDSAYRTLMNSIAATGCAVLNANDPATAALAEHCCCGVVYFAFDERHPLLSRHREQGGRVVFVREQMVILADGIHETSLVSLEQIPTIDIELVLAVAGAAWSLHIPFKTIRTGLVSYSPAAIPADQPCTTSCNGQGASHSEASGSYKSNGSHNGKSSHIAPTANEANMPASGSSEATR